ncbi:MAG: HAD-IIIC family phosphatase [Terriglobales bacterium]
MNSDVFNLRVVSDFNIETLGRYLDNEACWPRVKTANAPFGQMFPSLLEAANGDSDQDFCFIWTTLEGAVPSSRKMLDFDLVDRDALFAEVSYFAECVKKSHTRFKATFVASWTLPSFYRGLGILDLQNTTGLRRLTLEMNLALVKALEGSAGIYVLDSSRWLEVAANPWSPKLWYLSKTPYRSEVFGRTAQELKVAIGTVLGSTRKLIVVDLDDTLWGGIVGEVGCENIVLGGHDHKGEAFVDFQRALKSLRNRGILLAIASKNQEEIALQAFQKRPEMVLHLEDFAAWRINWHDKAANIAALASELNLGLQSIVFIDDNPVERARVREALPEVLVPEWPEDKTSYASTLLQMNCFDLPQITDEDRARTEMYVSAREREKGKAEYQSVEDWLHSLETTVTVEELNESNLPRVVQLLNKTNQMNLSTRRMTGPELSTWLKQERRKLWAFRVRDKFSDSGLTGILSLQVGADSCRIMDFLLSCRVMGRDIEQVMLAVAVQCCRGLGCAELTAKYLETAKNKPCLDFWMKSGFAYSEAENSFSWAAAQPYPVPSHIELIGLNGDQSECGWFRGQEGNVSPVLL